MQNFKCARGLLCLTILLMLVTLYGCEKIKVNDLDKENNAILSKNTISEQVGPSNQLDPIEKGDTIDKNTEEKKVIQKETETLKEGQSTLLETTPSPEEETMIPFTVVLDAGHQEKGNSEKEPIGPGALETKPKVSSGTQGVITKVPEYKVNLQVSLKLQKLLEEKGYRVVMIRETHDVDIPNSERAKIANLENADAFVRIHCNGTDNAEMAGALTICQTKDNPYCGDLYEQSYALSNYIVNELCEATGAKNIGVIKTDTMSGINWCEVPVTIVEMGYMTNSVEDSLLCDDEYQNKLADGIAKGIELYLQNK